MPVCSPGQRTDEIAEAKPATLQARGQATRARGRVRIGVPKKLIVAPRNDRNSWISFSGMLKKSAQQ
jgi:hypothetical protein